MKFIIDNWVQISFLLVAIGYVMKVLLDNSFKKKEIRYNLFLNNRVKAIEQFLSDYANLEVSYADTFYSYFQKILNSKEADDIILPLRYKLTDSLSTLQLYTSNAEFEEFNKVYSNFMFLMNKSTSLKHEVGISEVERCNELSDFLRKNKNENKILITKIIKSIQQNIFDQNL